MLSILSLTSILRMQLLENSNDSKNPDFWNLEATKFVNKVNQVLRHHSGNRITEFLVKFPLSSVNALLLDRWVAFAAQSGSENLKFILYDSHCTVRAPREEQYKFPLEYFVDVRSCQLNQLFLCMCLLETSPANLSGFSCLNSLILIHVSVVDSVFLNIMSSCHALQHLYLRKCSELINLRTSHAQLVFMRIYNCRRLKCISIHAEKLQYFSYIGKKVDIEYECAPVLCELEALFVNYSEFPSDFIGAFPHLKTLMLQFPSQSQVSHVLHNSGRFARLKEITLCLLTSWKKSIRSVAYLLEAAPLVEKLRLEVHGNLRPPKNLKIRWPKKLTHTRLRTIRIGGFSGDSELIQLLFFLLSCSPMLKKLLIDTHRYMCKTSKWIRVRSEDATRCNHAREVAATCLAPNVPPTVEFSIM